MCNDILSTLRNSQIVSFAGIKEVYTVGPRKLNLPSWWGRKLIRERSLCSFSSTLSDQLSLSPQKEFNHYLDANSYKTHIDIFLRLHRKFLSSLDTFDTLFSVTPVLPVPRPFY